MYNQCIRNIIVKMFKATSFLLLIIVNSSLAEDYILAVEETKGTIMDTFYKEMCCNSSNSGKKFIVEQDNDIKIAFCPSIVPKLCRVYSSCSEVFQEVSDGINDFHYISDGTVQNSKLVYCTMENQCNLEGPWTRLVHLNMTDGYSKCPEEFKLYEANETRACGRPLTSTGGCVGVKFPVTSYNEYSHICGRVKGYQFGSPDANDVMHGAAEFNNIDSYYVDGISITRGYPRQHIWTLMAGLNELAVPIPDGNPFCPCADVNFTQPATQSFVGSDYYCESGFPGLSDWDPIPYFLDPLWDGQDCNGEQQCCSSDLNLPWFHKVLLSPTTDYIEFRVCADQGTDNEDVLFAEYEIYVK